MNVNRVGRRGTHAQSTFYDFQQNTVILSYITAVIFISVVSSNANMS